MLKNSPFKMPKLKLYIGKIKFYTPYFEPVGFKSSIISIRKLELRNEEQHNEYVKRYPFKKDSLEARYLNLPMVKRSKSKILFNRYYVSWGSPIKFVKLKLGWKEKWCLPVFEWSPSYQLWFFKWQVVFYYEIENHELFWEMYLWWKYFSDCDIEKAENTWQWINSETKLSTWDKNFLKK